VAALLFALLALAVPAVAQADDSVVVPPTGTVYNDLAVAWWQYAYGQPLKTNPLVDPTGANCATGQSGSVFFLAGTNGSGKVTRDQCTVTGQKQLFFPLLNAIDFHAFPNDGLTTPKKVYADFQSYGFRADKLKALVDDVPIDNLNPATTPYRACAAPVAGCTPDSFSFTLPKDNLFTASYGLPARTYAPAVQDGYYLLLNPLKPGQHTIKFFGTGYFGESVTQDITYRLLVI
jgi:hypothetical protein